MTVYHITPVSTKQAGTWTSPAALVTGEEGIKATLILLDSDLQDEPDTTILEWSIQKSNNGVDGWTDQISTVIHGNNGSPYYKPIKLSITINEMVGQYLRTVTVTNARFRFGIDLEVI